MRKIGYCRVSSSHQNLDRQVGALRAERVDVIFREKASGKSVKGRPEPEKAIARQKRIHTNWPETARARQKSYRPKSKP